MGIKVFDKTLVFKTEIDDFSSMVISRKYCDIESVTIKVNASKQGTEHLIRGAYVYPEKMPNKFFRIYQRTVTDANGVENLQVVGYSAMKLLKQRVTIPPTGQDRQEEAGSLETVVKAYIDSNCISSATASRNFSFMELATDQGRGQVISDGTRYKNLCSEIQRILSLDDFGFTAEFDSESQTLILDIYQGADRTSANTDGNPPVIFAKKYDNIKSATVDENEASMQNYILVGGQGSGDVRDIQVAYIGSSAPSGPDRTEIFVDARNTSDPAELLLKGYESIVPGTVTLDADISPNSNQIYEEDFFLGDKVTVLAGGLQLNTRITEVVEAYEVGSPRKVNIIFGNKAIDILDTIKNLNKRIAELESI